ncbi:MAG TPA: O-antigen ligase family protein [Candidatus Dojkabacteria bacterium]|nr:O-antigen ligase family protein [Candidatus Dojkabacteria bacterium]
MSKQTKNTKNSNSILIATFFLFFATAIMGRLSAFVDYYFTYWNIEVSDRLISKLIWATFYLLFVVIVLINDIFRYWREINDGKEYTNVKNSLSINTKQENIQGKVTLNRKKEFTFRNKINILILKIWESKVAFYKENKIIVWASLAIVVSSLFSALFAYNKSESIWGLPYYALLVSIPLMIKYVWGNKLQFKLVIFQNIILIVLALVALYQSRIYNYLGAEVHPVISFFDTYGGFMPISFFLIWDDLIYLRPSSLMVDPNFLAIFSVIALSYNAAFLPRVREIKKHFWRIVTTVILCSSIFSVAYIVIASASRTAVLMLVVAISTYLTIKVVSYISSRLSLVRKKPAKLYSSVIWVYLYNIYLRIKDGLLLKDVSSLQRIEYAKISLQAFKEYPVTGIGIGSYGDYYRNVFDSSAGVATPHNAYMRTLAEMGLLGVAAFLFYSVAFVKVSLDNRKYVYLATLFGIAAGSIFYDFIMTPWMWIYFGIIYADATNKKTE